MQLPPGPPPHLVGRRERPARRRRDPRRANTSTSSRAPPGTRRPGRRLAGRGTGRAPGWPGCRAPSGARRRGAPAGQRRSSPGRSARRRSAPRPLPARRAAQPRPPARPAALRASAPSDVAAWFSPRVGRAGGDDGHRLRRLLARPARGPMMDGVPTFVERQRFASNRSAVVLTAVLVAALAALVAIQAANARAAGGAPAAFWIPAGVALVLDREPLRPGRPHRGRARRRPRRVPRQDPDDPVSRHRGRRGHHLPPAARDYGGWGYRLGRNRTRAYTASGTRACSSPSPATSAC